MEGPSKEALGISLNQLRKFDNLTLIMLTDRMENKLSKINKSQYEITSPKEKRILEIFVDQCHMVCMERNLAI